MTSIKYKIVITIDTKGVISVDGPLQDKGVMYALLECAKDVVREYKPSPLMGTNGAPLQSRQGGG